MKAIKFKVRRQTLDILSQNYSNQNYRLPTQTLSIEQHFGIAPSLLCVEKLGKVYLLRLC